MRKFMDRYRHTLRLRDKFFDRLNGIVSVKADVHNLGSGLKFATAQKQFQEEIGH
jgi:hypothetical protein